MLRLYISLGVTILFILSSSVNAQDNSELVRLFNEDQKARQASDVDWEILDKNDAERRNKVLDLLEAGKIISAEEHFYAAVIFQHSGSVEDIRLAHSLATISSRLGYKRANWLKAASWDRLMMYFKQPQWYGTQYTVDKSGEWYLYEVNIDVITDEDREEWNVPPLSESKNKADNIK